MANIVGVNLAFGGAADTYFEDLPLFQDLIPWSKGFQNVTSPGNIGASWVATDANGWPTTDFGIILHHSSLSPSWASNPLFCGFISNGSATETITGSGATISSVNRSAAPLVTFQLTPTATTWGVTITGTTSGATGIYAYLNEYSANAVNGHIDITPANVLAGKPIFTAEALAVFGPFNRYRTMWGQNAWYRVGGIVVQLASTATAGSTSATLVANNVQPGTYLMVFRPSTTQSTWDVRSIVITSAGQTSISWSGALTFDATAVALPHSSSTRNTATNVKANLGWGQTFAVGTDGYPLDWFLAMSVKTGKQLWSHIPVHDDGTYYQAHLQDIHDNAPAGVDQYIEFDNEIWNNVGEVGPVLNGLAALNGLTEAQQLATQIHTVANYGRTLFGSDWNSRIRLVLAWQLGVSAFINQLLQYMISQGWSPSADLWCLSTAPYIVGQPAITSSDTTAQILTKVQTAATFPTSQLGPTQTNCHVEKSIAMALWYKLPGVYECYEWGWDSVTDYNNSGSNANIGLAIMDPGMEAIQHSYGQWSLDMGIKGFNDFEGGCSVDTTGASPKYEFSNNYATLVSTGSPRLNGLIDTMNGSFTPSRNVVQNSGDWIDARLYLDVSLATTAGYPTFTTISNISPVNNYNGGWKIQCPTAVTFKLQVYFTTTASATMNAYLDGTQVATAVSIPNGLTWSGSPTGSSPPVVFATLTLSAGVHYIELGNIASIPGVTANALQFQANTVPISLVQKTKGRATATSTPVTITGVTAGDLLPIVVIANGTATLTSITDSSGDTVNTAVALAFGTGAGCGIYYVQNAQAGSHTITPNWSTSIGAEVMISEYSNAATASAFDVGSAVATGASTTIATASITPAQNGELIILGVGTQGTSTTYSAFTNGFTEEDFTSGTSPVAAWADLIQTTAASISGGLTQSTTGGWAAAIAAFKPAGSPPPSSSAPRLMLLGVG